MSDIPRALRDEVVSRAADRCEYCGLAQQGQEATFHIDHVTPRAKKGPTTVENLALACVSCSLRKGARTEALDPSTGAVVELFDPRRHAWSDHFAWRGDDVVVGLIEVGRATINVLDLNRSLIRAIRRVEAELGRHPPA